MSSATVDISTFGYCQAVAEIIGFDRIGDSGQTKVDFRKLFYPVNIDKGAYAVKNYAEVMAYADSSKTIQTTRERLGELRMALSGIRAGRNLETDDEETSSAQTSQEDLVSQMQRKEAVIYSIKKAHLKRSQKKTKEVSHVGQEEVNPDEVVNSVSEQPNTADETQQARTSKKVRISDLSTLDTFSFYDKDEYAPYLIFGEKQSRVLLLASAGHGKTTLLRRICLFYSQLQLNDGELDELDVEIRSRYQLPRDKYIPVLIKLRNAIDNNFEIETLIKQSVLGFVREKYEDFSQSEIEEGYESWINSVYNEKEKILLLIDGLDEVPDRHKMEFLLLLERYISQHEDTKLILTTRVAGLNDEEILSLFDRLEFTSRAILPFKQEETKAYALNWIKQTQPEDSQERLINSLDQLISNKKFAYLRNFLRHPLELLIILKQLVSDNLALNKYQMFQNILWEMFTNHESFVMRERIFNDKMTLLGFIAYQMQLGDRLFISKEEIKALGDKFLDLSFHSDFIKQSNMFDSVIDFLESLASNSGIVESSVRIDEETGQEQTLYTFPIRAYQEYMCAYACCNLRLDNDTKPKPTEIAIKYLKDKRWYDVVSFILSDLQNNDKSTYDILVAEIIKTLGKEMDDITFLKGLLETGVTLSNENANALAEKYLSSVILSKDQRDILDICMLGDSAVSLVYMLKLKTKEALDKKRQNFIDAYARATILWAHSTQRCIFEEVYKFLKSPIELNFKTAATMIVVLTEMILDEESPLFAELLEQDDCETPDMCELLLQKFQETNDVIYVMALSCLYLSEDYTDKAKEILLSNYKCAIAIRKALEQRATDFYSFFTKPEIDENKVVYLWFKRLVYTLGTYPITRRLFRHPVSEINPMVEGALKAFYEKAKKVDGIDRIAAILAKYNYFQPNDYEIGTLLDDEDGTVLSEKASRRMRRHAKISFSEFEKEGLLQEKSNFQNIKEKVSALITEKRYTEAIATLYDNISSLKQGQEGEAYALIAIISVVKRITELPDGRKIDVEQCLEKASFARIHYLFVEFYRHIQNEDYIKALDVLYDENANSTRIWSSLRYNEFLQKLFDTSDVLVFLKEQCNLKASLNKLLKIENEQTRALSTLVAEIDIIIDILENL